jgi:hypothetical protein
MSESDNKLSGNKLTVTVADPAAEISIIDGNFNRIARSVGHFEQNLSPGIYKVQVQVGPKVDEQLVALDQSRDLQFTAPDIPTAVPLESSSRSHEYHRQFAMSAAANVIDRFGSGSSIFVFAREWTKSSTGTDENPAQDLSLFKEDGTLLVKIADRAEVHLEGDPAAGWRADLTPGAYRVRLELPDGSGYERSLYATPGFQTQLFLLHREYLLNDHSVCCRADLDTGAVAMSANFAFDPFAPGPRMTALATYALTQTRRILSDAVVQDLLDAKYDDPMLGIVGAHLVLRDQPQDLQTFQTVTDNLRRVVGLDHPDLMALWLARQDRGDVATPQLRTPPMLRRSWAIATEKSVPNPDVIAPELDLDATASAPWLIWRADSAALAASEAALGRGGFATTALGEYLAARNRSDEELARDMEGFVVKTGNRLRSMLPNALQTFVAPRTPDPATPLKLTEDDKIELARVLGVSGRVLENTLKKLSS